MDQLSMRLFGPPRIEIDSKPVEINRRKAVALLIYLAITQQSHSRDALATLFWPEADQSRARASLRSVLWSLNKTPLAVWLVVEAEMVSLRNVGETLKVDVLRFQDLLSASKRHDQPAPVICDDCRALLAEAVSLYENDFLAGFTLPDAPAFDDWQFFQANGLRQDLSSTLQDLIQFHSAGGDFEGAIPYARRLVSLDPLHEPAHQILMRLYAESGQQSAALRQYEICKETLESELGFEPSEETTRLYERIRSGDWKTEAVIGKPAKPAEVPAASPHNLPPDSTPLVGREQELTRLAAYLDEPSTRLLTIVGPGGIGKTRLALAAAADQASRANFPDGVYFVSLTPLSEPEAIVPAISEAVGYPFQPDSRTPRQQIIDYLSQKSILLLLDNLEHLLTGHQNDGAALVADLLQRAPGLKILTTSRERLNLYEEQRYPLGGLAFPDSDNVAKDTDYAAAALFLQTVRRKLPDFEVTSADEPLLSDVCRLVEGMPLALELAASWIELLSLGEIAAEIRQNLGFLETDLLNVPARHRSMQAVFDSSWRTLSETEREVYARLSVFRGDFTQNAAKEVSGASLKLLTGFVNKSLLRFDQSRKRFEIHELLRQYAAEKLAESTTQTRDRHAAYYCAFLQEREPDLKGGRQEQTLAEIEADLENAREAWEWAVEQCQAENLEKALVPLSLFYQSRSRSEEGETMCQKAVEKLTSMSPQNRTELHSLLLVKALTWHGSFNQASGEYDRARRSLQEARDIFSDLTLKGENVTAALALLLLRLSDYFIINEFGGEAKRLNQESLSLFRSIDDAWGVTLALDGLSQKYMNLGLHKQAIQLHEECLEIRRRMQNKRGIARSFNVLGLLVLHIGQIERSEAYLRESLSLYRSMNNRALISDPLAVLGINLLFGGKFEECIASYEECWTIHRELGLPQEPFTANVGMARAKINLGRYQEARAQAQENLATYRSIDHSWSTAFTLFNLGRIDLVKSNAKQALQNFEESAELLQNINERSLLPEVLFCLAYTFQTLQDRQQAIEYMIRSLKIVVETKPLNTMRFELPGMALLLADEGQQERAIEFYAAAFQSPYIANSRWFEDIAGRRIAEVEATLPSDVVLAAKKRGQARDLAGTVKDLLVELSKTG